jgi:predicted permease
VDVGFNTRNLVLFRVNPSLNRYDDAKAVALYQQLSDGLRSVAGVRSVALSNVQLLSGSVNSTSIFVQGRTYAPGQRDSINRLVTSPGYFDTMEMPMRLGRGFTDRDDQKAPKVTVINEAAARKCFRRNPSAGVSVRASKWPVRWRLSVCATPSRQRPRRSFRRRYAPYLQARLNNAIFGCRTAGDPVGVTGSIREAVRKIDPNLPLMNVSTQVEQVEKRLLQERVFAQAYALFGALALLLASVGLFGLMSYSVARRTNEIGIRMALGAQSYDVLRLVMGESMTLVTTGVGIGLAVALAASRLVESLLFGLAPTDISTMLGAMLVLVAVSALAGYLPARRAARVDPLVALHYE